MATESSDSSAVATLDELARLLEFDDEVDGGDAAGEADGRSLLDVLHVMEGEAAGDREEETDQQDSEMSSGEVSGSILRFLLSDEGGAKTTSAPEAEVDANYHTSEAQQNKSIIESESGLLPSNSGSIQVLRPNE